MRSLAAAAALGAFMVVAGCGKPVLRVADASLGDYYTEEEYEKLSDEQRAEYCRELADQRDLFQEQIAEAQIALDEIHGRAEPERRELDSLRTSADDLERRLAAALEERPRGRGEPDRAPGGDTGAYVIRKGDTLWKISGRDDVYGRPERWRRLYRANRARIQDPDRIYPGQEIQIPR